MLDVDNNKYKKCFLRYCQSLIWKDQSFSFSILWHFAWCEVRIDRMKMSRELWEKLDPMALYGAHLARLKLTWTKQFTILRGAAKDCSLEFSGFSICVKPSSTSVSLALALFNVNWLSHTGHCYANLFLFRFWRLLQIQRLNFHFIPIFTTVSNCVGKCDFELNTTKPQLLIYSSTRHFHFSPRSHFLLISTIFNSTLSWSHQL